MFRRLLFTLIGAALLVPVSVTRAELISFIHALPDGPGEWTSNSPIDINFDGVCEYTRIFYGDKIGPLKINQGKYKIAVHAHEVGAPCQGKKLAAGKVKIKKKAEVDVVVYLANSSGGGKVGKIKTFNNKKSLRPVLKEEWDAAIEIRSVYDFGTVTADVDRAGAQIGSGDVAPGKTLGPIETTADSHEMTVMQGDVTIDTKEGLVKNVHAYWAYVVGAVDEQARELLLFESIPQEPPPRGGGGDGGKEDKNKNACCIGGTCSTLSFNFCSVSTGTYMGEVGCKPNPCR